VRGFRVQGWMGYSYLSSCYVKWLAAWVFGQLRGLDAAWNDCRRQFYSRGTRDKASLLLTLLTSTLLLLRIFLLHQKKENKMTDYKFYLIILKKGGCVAHFSQIRALGRGSL
jgi:hypothetical protein